MTERIENAGCFCGSIRARCQGEPFWTNYDHDDDCRRAIGGPLTIWVGYRPDQVTFLKGKPKTYSKTPGVVRSFCGRCGSSIGYIDEGIADEYYLTSGFFDHPERFKPSAHGYWKLELPWIEFSDDLPRVDEYTRRRDPKLGNPNTR